MTESQNHDTPIATTRPPWVVPVVFLLVGLLGGYLIARPDSSEQSSSEQNNPNRFAKLLSPGVSAPVVPEFKAPQKQFLRLNKEQDKPKSLDVAVSTYRLKSGEDLEVSLVGAIHIADKEYFAALNQEFNKYDVVLYELVAPKDTRPKPEQEQNGSILSSFQTTLSDLLQVEHQLVGVDYSPTHFVHADLSFPDLVAEGKRRGETPFTLFAGITLDALRLVQKAEYEASKAGSTSQQESESLEDIVALLSDPTRLRRQFAEVLVQSEEQGMAGFTTLAPYLIDVRNKAAIDVFQKQRALGKKRIAIFYGAAHLPDFEQRLIKEFKMARTETRWIPAWDLGREIPKKDPLRLFIQLFRSIQQSNQASNLPG